jgi:hypothetical protein
MDIPTRFVLIIILFGQASKYDVYAKFWGYVVANAEPLCVKLFNVMQCCILVNAKGRA